jgi:[NiFe] hydrogenase diaphorase moiety large subunit
MEESCGYCTPCRVGNVLMKERLERILRGEGVLSDLSYLQDLGETIKTASRCGLGQTAANPVLSTLKNFRPVYAKLLSDDGDGLRRSFDLRRATELAAELTGRHVDPVEEPSRQ